MKRSRICRSSTIIVIWTQEKITADEKLPELGELWLSGDHYKWRAMRLCGVEETYITGEASYEEKFLKYAEILPKLAGNPCTNGRIWNWNRFSGSREAPKRRKRESHLRESERKTERAAREQSIGKI